MPLRPAAARARAGAPPAIAPPLALPPACYLTVPGLGNSGPDHWQTRWERDIAGCSRVEAGDWDAPPRQGWVATIDRAVGAATAPIVLVGHSLGCIAIAAWAAEAAVARAARVVAALLVAPPDVAQQGADLRLVRFGRPPATALPFAALVVASADDGYCTLARSRALARDWGADCVDLGRQGHLNAQSRLGDWHLGRALLADLIARAGLPGGGPTPPVPADRLARRPRCKVSKMADPEAR